MPFPKLQDLQPQSFNPPRLSPPPDAISVRPQPNPQALQQLSQAAEKRAEAISNTKAEVIDRRQRLGRTPLPTNSAIDNSEMASLPAEIAALIPYLQQTATQQQLKELIDNLRGVPRGMIELKQLLDTMHSKITHPGGNSKPTSDAWTNASLNPEVSQNFKLILHALNQLYTAQTGKSIPPPQQPFKWNLPIQQWKDKAVQWAKKWSKPIEVLTIVLLTSWLTTLWVTHLLSAKSTGTQHPQAQEKKS